MKVDGSRWETWLSLLSVPWALWPSCGFACLSFVARCSSCWFVFNVLWTVGHFTGTVGNWKLCNELNDKEGKNTHTHKVFFKAKIFHFVFIFIFVVLVTEARALC